MTFFSIKLQLKGPKDTTIHTGERHKWLNGLWKSLKNAWLEESSFVLHTYWGHYNNFIGNPKSHM